MRPFFPVLFFLLVASKAIACPMCNIHNYMYSSIRSSSYVIKAEVVKKKGKEKAEILITQVYFQDTMRMRGHEERMVEGSRMDYYFSDPESWVGREYIFCDPRVSGASFSWFSAFMEEEVVRILDTSWVPQTEQEAVECLKGISVYSVNLGFDYLKGTDKELLDLIESEVKLKLQDSVAINPYSHWQMANLVTALRQIDSRKSHAFFVQTADSLARLPSKPFRISRFNMVDVAAVFFECAHRELSGLGEKPKRFHLDVSNYWSSDLGGVYATYAYLSGQKEMKVKEDVPLSFYGIVMAMSRESKNWQRAKVKALYQILLQRFPDDHRLSTVIEEFNVDLQEHN